MTDPTVGDTPLPVIGDALEEYLPGIIGRDYSVGVARAIIRRLDDAGWLRTPAERARAARVRAHTGPDTNPR